MKDMHILLDVILLAKILIVGMKVNVQSCLLQDDCCNSYTPKNYKICPGDNAGLYNKMEKISDILYLYVKTVIFCDQGFKKSGFCQR